MERTLPNPDDDDLFNPASSSNLASLFGTSISFKQDTDASLIYTAPKQPRASGQETPKTTKTPLKSTQTPQSAVIYTKFVDAFKLVDKNYTSIGKCGLAIIGNETLNTYEIIIYKSKQDILARAKLKPDFIFTIQTNNFGSFFDEQRQGWSVHFENGDVIKEFVNKLKLYDIKVTNIQQDGLSTAKPKIDENLNGREKDSDSTSDTSGSHARATILSRMAKMGQSILPAVNLPKKASEHSDSETEEKTPIRKTVKKRQKATPSNGELNSEKTKGASPSYPVNVQTPVASEFVVINGQIVPAAVLKPILSSPLTTPFPNPYNIPNQILFNQTQPQISPSVTDSLHVFIAENRTHNCEIRMHLSQLSSKLDNMLSSLEKGSANTDSSTKTNNLEASFVEKYRKLEEAEDVICNLQQQQNKLNETAAINEEIINKLKQQIEDQNNLVLKQEEQMREIERQKRLLEEQVQQNTDFEQKLVEAQQTINELRCTIDNQKLDLENLNKSCEKNNYIVEIDKLNESVSNLKSQLVDKNSRVDLFSKKLKQSMNTLYQEVLENFTDENESFQSTQIKQILSQKLKSTTLTIIQEFQNDFKDSTSTVT